MNDYGYAERVDYTIDVPTPDLRIVRQPQYRLTTRGKAVVVIAWVGIAYMLGGFVLPSLTLWWVRN